MIKSIWCWRRWIISAEQAQWISRLGPELAWALSEKPCRSLLTVYPGTRLAALRLVRSWGGQARLIKPKEWLPQGPAPILRIGTALQIFHEKPDGRPEPDVIRLHVPHGLAFGSGEHATTFMLLRALVRHGRLNTVLDLGTGSGILALTARQLGAQKIRAIDWDAESIRTARRNEQLNFREPSIRWQKADVKRLRARADLVLANLFSGILCEAAIPIAASVAPGGELWLSGILDSQEEEVTTAYQKLGLNLSGVTHRGKWVMLQWRKNGRLTSKQGR